MADAANSTTALQKHFESTYHSLRIGIALIGIVLPLLLWLGGFMSGVELQGSMSAYYYTPWRDVFVGGLCGVGMALYLYKGFSTEENVALNVAGACALLVGLCPTRSGDEWLPVNYLHVASAVVFFLSLAYVSLFRAEDTLSLIRDGHRAKRYALSYRSLGVAMLGSPLAALAAAWFLRSPSGHTSKVFFIEAFGVWAFGFYWLVKSREMKESSADRAANEGVLRPMSVKGRARAPGSLVQVAQIDSSDGDQAHHG